MESTNAKPVAAAAAEGEERNPNNVVDNPPSNGNDGENQRRRTPFTDLSQVDSDLALARTLQEQERAYMMLRMEGGVVSDYESWETGIFGHDDGDDGGDDDVDHDDYDDAGEEDNNVTDVEVDDELDDDEDVFDMYDHDGVENESQNIELDPSAFSSDEAYARALQDAEEREMAARLLALAGINGVIIGEGDDDDDDDDDEDDHGDNSQDAWDEVDPDELSYEELLALGEIVGTESRGLSVDTIASLPSVNFKSQGEQVGISDSCVICRLDYEDDDTLTVLSCKHSYHTECINDWLKINKVCPVCSTEVSTSGKS